MRYLQISGNTRKIFCFFNKTTINQKYKRCSFNSDLKKNISLCIQYVVHLPDKNLRKLSFSWNRKLFILNVKVVLKLFYEASDLSLLSNISKDFQLYSNSENMR